MKAYELLATPDKWCKWVFAKTSRGRTIGPNEPNACRWCVAGAIRRVYQDAEEQSKAFDRVLKHPDVQKISKNPYSGIARWNDQPKTTFEDIKRVLQEVDV